MTPIILFSLPRAGSTLLQRQLASHKEISTTSEPWLLLPLIYALKPDGVCSEYSHTVAVTALKEFIDKLDEKELGYEQELRKFILRLYSMACRNNEEYFLDKTPRYNLVADEVYNLLPNAKFIYLWRNPLSIIASMIETWGGGRWNIFRFESDLKKGLNNMISSYKTNKDKAISIKYEDAICDTKGELSKIFSYLNLEQPVDIESLFVKVKLSGSMGDPTGVKKYSAISREPLDKWKSTLGGPLRKLWCKKYLHEIGDANLKVMGYSLSDLIKELDATPITLRNITADAYYMSKGQLRKLIKTRLNGFSS